MNENTVKKTRAVKDDKVHENIKENWKTQDAKVSTDAPTKKIVTDVEMKTGVNRQKTMPVPPQQKKINSHSEKVDDAEKIMNKRIQKSNSEKLKFTGDRKSQGTSHASSSDIIEVDLDLVKKEVIDVVS